VSTLNVDVLFIVNTNQVPVANKTGVTVTTPEIRGHCYQANCTLCTPTSIQFTPVVEDRFNVILLLLMPLYSYLL
jgi:hypothetical protein